MGKILELCWENPNLLWPKIWLERVTRFLERISMFKTSYIIFIFGMFASAGSRLSGSSVYMRCTTNVRAECINNECINIMYN